MLVMINDIHCTVGVATIQTWGLFDLVLIFEFKYESFLFKVKKWGEKF